MDTLMNVTVGQIVGAITAFVAFVTLFIEFNKKIQKFPISAVLNWIGERTNKNLSAQVKSLEDQIKDLEKKVDALDTKQVSMDYEFEKRNTVNCRVRILQFADELRRKIKHSQESFDQVFDDIDVYEKYCAAHPEFKNNKTMTAKERIKAAYDGCMEQNDFL